MNNFLHLPLALRAVSALMVRALIFQYFLNGFVLPVPIITVVFLLVLSFLFSKWPRTSAGLALLPGVLIPVSVLLGYLSGTVPLWLLVFDWVIFGWLVLSVLKLFLFKRQMVETHNNKV